MASRAPFVVYLIGIALVGFFYTPIRVVIASDSMFAVAVVFYLVVLRLIGRFVQWLLRERGV